MPGNSIENTGSLRLIDFGYSKKYIDLKGEHVKEEDETEFDSNIMFCST